MPIPRKQFDKSIDTLSVKVLKFLKSHPDEVFEIEELAAAMGGRQLEVWAVLDDLKRRKQVTGKCIKGKGYYCV
jgi:hypothetical protein